MKNAAAVHGLDLKIVHLSDLLIHEHADPKRVVRLVSEMRRDGFIRNPIIVGRILPRSRKYLLLDGVTRFSALKVMGVKDAFVQVVDYMDENVKTGAWTHIITMTRMMTDDEEESEFVKRLNSIRDVTIKKEKTRKTVERKLKNRKIIAYCFFTASKAYYAIIYCGRGEFLARVKKLNEVVDIIYGHGAEEEEIYRMKNRDDDFLFRNRRKTGVLIVFPVYTKEEIIRASLKKTILPAGTTRHTIQRRALRFNFPLKILKNGNNNKTLREKNNVLKKLIQDRVKNRNIRLYSEQVLMFDE